MYPFSISIDERVPLKFLLSQRLGEIKKSTELLIELLEFCNYNGRPRLYVSKFDILQMYKKCTPSDRQIYP